MLKTFSWRHAIGLMLVVCMVSIGVGAVLAQEEPDLPEPEVPVIDLSAAADEPAEPVEPALPVVVIPEITVNETTVNSPFMTITEITNLQPNGLVSVLNPTYTWQVNVPLPLTGTAGFNFELYEAQVPLDPPTPMGDPLTSTILNGNPLSITDTCDRTTGVCTFANAGVELVNGRAYYWQVSSIADPFPSADATFVVRLPFVSPGAGDIIATTTPFISFDQVPGAQFYQFASWVPERRVSAWSDWFSAEDSTFPGYEEGICESGICRVRPDVQLTKGTEGQGDTNVQIWYRIWDGQVGPWQTLLPNVEDTFTIIAPDVDADLDAGATPGRAKFTLNRQFTTVETLSGLTVTTAPDYYRIFIIDPITRARADEWYVVDETSCSAEDVCDLLPLDGVQDLLFNGAYDYYVLGYDTLIDGYTPWSARQSYTIAELAPQISSVQYAGLYDSIGPDPVNPIPRAPIETWTQCSGLTPSTVEPVCDNGRPILHFQPNVGSFSGDWFQIIAFDVADRTLAYNHWHNNATGQTTNTDPNSFYFECLENTGWQADSGTWAFEDLTCFFQLGEFNGLDGGKQYQWYIRTFGPGRLSTGGIVGYTQPGGSSDPLNIASFSIRGENPVTDLDVLFLTGTMGSLTSTTSTYIENEPIFTWTEATGATWYELRIRSPLDPSNPNAERQVYYEQWHRLGTGRDNVRCVNGECGFTPPGNFFLLNGTYELSVRYWNGGLSDRAETTFTMNAGAPAPVENTAAMIVFNNESLTGTVTPVFQWPHAQGTTWYQIRFSGPNVRNTTTGGWYRAYEICRPDENGVVTCAVRPPIGNVILQGGTFEWALDSWNGSGQAPVTGSTATFNLSSQATGVVTPVYPASPLTHTLTNTNTLELYFTPADNASWYQVYVGQQGAAPAIFQWYYLPSAESFDYPANAINRCGDNDMAFGILNSTRENLCRIIPMTTADDGSMYPTELWSAGQYQWWTQAYGPAGLSTQGVNGTGWVRADINLDVPRSTGVDLRTVRNQDFIPLDGGVVTSVEAVYWERATIAEWYRVQIYNEADGELLHLGWIERNLAGCGPQNNALCYLDIAATNRFGSPSIFGTYRMDMGTWSRFNDITPEIEVGLPGPNQKQFILFTIL